MAVQQQQRVIDGESSRPRARSGREVRRRELRPGWGTGRGTRPTSRPAGAVSAPRLTALPESGPIGCRVQAPVVRTVTVVIPALPTSRCRLTERGIALVLATGLAIAAAAFVVVSLTALRVTGDSYAPMGQLTQQMTRQR